MRKKHGAGKPLRTQTVVALGFLLLILLLAALLMLPLASVSGQWTDPLTALFTATSAVCVTGLVVVDTATHWSLFGRLAILIGIQIGGLGVMTVLSLVSLLLGRRIGLRQRTLLLESISGLQLSGVVSLVRRALLGALLIEGAGALLLCFVFVPLLGPIRGAAYAVFHSVSALCNAGFDLMGSVTGPYTSLESFAGDPLLNLTIVSLILIGGLGFLVWDDLASCRFHWKALQLHTQLVLLLTAALVLIPTFLFFLTEANASMAGFGLPERILASLFSAVTPRTAGFNTVPTAALSPSGSLMTILLMLTGGSPGSTAGGVKTTTMLAAALLAGSMLRREDEIHVLGRRIQEQTLRRACSILIIDLALSTLAALIILTVQPELPLRDVLIEVFSAINTVGMSTGITRQLSAISKLVLIVLMYAGRLGTLTFALLLTRRSASSPVRHPAGQLLVG